MRKLIICFVGLALLLLLIGGAGNAQTAASLEEILNDFNDKHPGSGVVVRNLTDNTEASINPNKKFTSASLYKLFVAQHLFEQKKAGALSFTQPTPLEDVAGQHSENVADCENNQSCIKAIWPSVPTGQSATVNQCLPKMIIYSDNICGKTFLDYTRDKVNKYPGYADTTMSPLQTSASDVAKLLADIANKTWVDEASSQAIYDLLKQQYHREKIPAGLPGGVEVANKTGEIHSASTGKSHDAAIIKAGSKTYILVILTNKNPDSSATKKVFADLSKQIYELISSGTATSNPSNASCAPEAATVTPSAQREKSPEEILTFPFYEPISDLCCEANFGGPADGGPLSGVHFPEVQDTAVLSAAIKKYIQKGWPTSPLIDYSDDFVRLGQKYDINPAIPVVIAQVEYQFGTEPDTKTNIEPKGLFGAPGRPDQYNYWAVRGGPEGSPDKGVDFDAYPSILEAMEDHYKLLSGKRGPPFTYLGPPQNYTTVSEIMNQYAPAFENDTPKYIQTILDGMKKLLTDGGAADSVEANTASISSGNCSSAGVSGDYGIVSADGYAFPIAAKKKSDYEKFGALSPVPCAGVGSCHHPFAPRGGYAFDLGVKGFGPDRSENAPVYAISDGIIVFIKHQRTNPNTQATHACNQLEFKSDLDDYVYWYGHLKYDPSFIAGQRYKAGQEIGRVGPSVCADDTAPHLHIDRGYPKGVMGGNEEHRDEGIIPLINKLYDELPD